MNNSEYRNLLREIGNRCIKAADNPHHDLDTAINQARQAVGMLQAERDAEISASIVQLGPVVVEQLSEVAP